MRDLFISVPLWLIAVVLFAFFVLVTVLARAVVTRRCSAESREELADEATRLLTGLAATFAFFVGFSITVTWGAVAAGQAAVEQQSSAVQNMSWSINNIPDKAEATLLRAKLRRYATAAAFENTDYLARGDTSQLPSAVPLDRFEDALHTYAFGPKVPKAEVSSLVTAAATLGSTSAAVSAVAHRTLPDLLAVLLLVTGLLVAAVMGVSTVTARHPVLMLIWCVIPALSITVVIALAFPFASGIGVDLAPMQSVAQQLAIH
ncbi:MAG: hypothetical protein F2813_08220 [Actinobacteria bacterium]|uniref:Unannotated protein n=1 Tax=freshwater metagenome TaxID=449393 RepID=A0A6J6A2B9_9ZZZZ|nr:hypothetical protein [Actinomycetota bacterium]